MQQEIKYFVRLVQCKILNKIFALDLCDVDMQTSIYMLEV
jgi:hypothetical protein